MKLFMMNVILNRENKLSDVSCGVLFYCLIKFNQKILILSRFIAKNHMFIFSVKDDIQLEGICWQQFSVTVKFREKKFVANSNKINIYWFSLIRQLKRDAIRHVWSRFVTKNDFSYVIMTTELCIKYFVI
jgi:hypothetical protein